MDSAASHSNCVNRAKVILKAAAATQSQQSPFQLTLDKRGLPVLLPYLKTNPNNRFRAGLKLPAELHNLKLGNCRRVISRNFRMKCGGKDEKLHRDQKKLRCRVSSLEGPPYTPLIHTRMRVSSHINLPESSGVA